MADGIDANEFGFSPSVKANGLLFCSGQVGLEADGSVPEDAGRQFRLAFEALGALLAEAGCGVADLVDLNTFHTNYPANMQKFMEEKARFLGRSVPAWTAVGVAALGYPQTLVEIKAIAVIPA